MYNPVNGKIDNKVIAFIELRPIAPVVNPIELPPAPPVISSSKFHINHFHNLGIPKVTQEPYRPTGFVKEAALKYIISTYFNPIYSDPSQYASQSAMNVEMDTQNLGNSTAKLSVFNNDEGDRHEQHYVIKGDNAALGKQNSLFGHRLSILILDEIQRKIEDKIKQKDEEYKVSYLINL